jgi:hypothetical protein
LALIKIQLEGLCLLGRLIGWAFSLRVLSFKSKGRLHEVSILGCPLKVLAKGRLTMRGMMG